MAPALGPVIGGLLAKFLGWRAIFWFLAIFSGVTLVLIVTCLSETNRHIVGNGSITPQGWNMSLTDAYNMRQRTRNAPKESPLVTDDQKQLHKVKWWRGLAGTFIVLKERDIIIALVLNAVA